jgi:hypothetical protein
MTTMKTSRKRLTIRLLICAVMAIGIFSGLVANLLNPRVGQFDYLLSAGLLLFLVLVALPTLVVAYLDYTDRCNK